MNINFSVQNQYIMRIDNNYVVARSKNYLYAQFSVSAEWINPIALFRKGEQAYAVEIKDNTCLVPWEVLAETGTFGVSVFCGDLITANIATVIVHESGFTEETEEALTPTPTIWEQYYKAVTESASQAQTAADDVKYMLAGAENIQEALETKQDKLKFDSSPTEYSENPVTSGGVFEGLAKKVSYTVSTEEDIDSFTALGIYYRNVTREYYGSKNDFTIISDESIDYIDPNDTSYVQTSPHFLLVTEQVPEEAGIVGESSIVQYRFANGVLQKRSKPQTQLGAWTDWQEYAVKSTTLAGYGITNAYTKTQIDEEFVANAESHDMLNSSIQGLVSAFGVLDMEVVQVEESLAEKADKTKIVVNDTDTAYTYAFADNYNNDIRLKASDIISIAFTFDDSEYAEDYKSGLAFDTGTTAPEIVYTNTGILNWIGTDCTLTDGLSIFTPQANKHYDIVFYYNGTQFVGVVNGFTVATIQQGIAEETTA